MCHSPWFKFSHDVMMLHIFTVMKIVACKEYVHCYLWCPHYYVFLKNVYSFPKFCTCVVALECFTIEGLWSKICFTYSWNKFLNICVESKKMYWEIFWASLAFALCHELLTVAYRGLANHCFSIAYCEKNSNNRASD